MKLAAVVALVAACGDNAAPTRPFCDTWQQWGIGPAHDGNSCVRGQPLARLLADVEIDPFVPEEKIDASGDLIVHYQSPLLSSYLVFAMRKGGTYTPCETKPPAPSLPPGPDCFEPDEMFRLNSQVWTEVAYGFHDGMMTEHWSFDSDWKPEPEVGFEPMFQPALVGNDRIAVPGAAGSVWLLDAATGRVIQHVVPFGDDADAYVAGALAVDAGGSIFYNALKLDHDNPYGMPEQGWLVAIDNDDVVRKADYSTLVGGAPAPDAGCVTSFDSQTQQLPWPPVDADGNPEPVPRAPCGGQVPGINSAPAFAADGTVYIASHAQFNEWYSYISSIDPSDFSTNWSASLRDRVDDGCGVNIPYATTSDPYGCRPGTRAGIDPNTGLLPAVAVDDSSSSSPVALPGGGVLYGGLTYYNGFRGHLMRFSNDGAFVGSYDFGWDTTPAVAGDHIILKDNHYGQNAQGVDLGPYFITELDDHLMPVWQFKSTETQSCARQMDGTIDCVTDHPNGFEWCINAPAVDRDGTTYVNSEDGHLYAITKDGQLRDKLFLEQAVGAAYTPLALDPDGRIYSLNSGHLLVVGQ